MPKNPRSDDEKTKPAADAPEDAAGKGEKTPKGKGGKGKGEAKGAPKAPEKPVSTNPNFRYIVRVVGTDLDGRRPTVLALTKIRGIGARMAEVACRSAGVTPRTLIGDLDESAVEGLEGVLQALPEKVPAWMTNHPVDWSTGLTRHLEGADLETARRDDINVLRMIRSYKGVRHERGQKVRGQRTRSNGRTGMAAGVLKKTAKEQAAAAAAEKGEKGGGGPAAPAAPAAAATPATGKAAAPAAKGAAAPAKAAPAAAAPADKKKG
jgi:small subunit ribosomal protein S13